MTFLAYFNDPHNAFGQWLTQSKGKQLSLLFAIFILCTYLPIWQWYVTQQKNTQLQIQLTEKQAELSHQQNLLASLKQHHLNNLPPQQMARLPTVSQQIQQHLHETHLQLISSQWLFSSKPIFYLQIEGHFSNLHQFLTALFTLPSFSLLSLSIKQIEISTESSIQSEIRLQLNPMEQ